jgi:Fe-S-cluster containining protein
MKKSFECKRCGLCCEQFNPFQKNEICPYYEYDDNSKKATCNIYNDISRPDICKNFPDKNSKCFLEGKSYSIEDIKKLRIKLRKGNYENRFFAKAVRH